MSILGYLFHFFRHNEYRKKLSSGKKELTKTEFRRVYNSLFAGDASDFAEHVFRTFDVNKDGKVDFREFVIGLSVSGSAELDKKLEWAFRMYDVNETGYITWDEMRQIIAVSETEFVLIIIIIIIIIIY